ncbi:hypothetical protein JCM8547_003203 [Rhodosporidiobolus lusitaniae]
MSAASPPPSPSKRNILRTLVTGCPPTSAEEHARRWNGSSRMEQVRGVEADRGTGGSGKVAGLVQGWEASLNGPSRPLPPSGPPLPYRASPSPSQQAYQRPALLSMSQPSSASSASPTSPRGTVPASFFQAQQARRTPSPLPPKAASHAPPPPPGKENRTRPISFLQPSLPSPSVAAQHGHSSDSSRSPSTSETVSTRTDVSTATTALTVDTMATRSSGSTHASSLVTNSAENAYVGVASRVDVRADATPRKAMVPPTVGTSTRTEGLRAPQIVATAPTPARQGASAPAPRPVSMHACSSFAPPPPHLNYTRPAAPEPHQRPAPRPQTSFFEDLPPSCSPEPRSPTFGGDRYEPLPLGNTPVLRQGQQAPPASVKTRGRPRASSLGAGLKAAFKEEEAKPETPQEKQRRIEAEFESLLDTMQLPDRTVKYKMLGLALPLKEEMLRSASNPPSTSSSTLRPPSRPTPSRGRSLNLNDSHAPSAAPPASKKEGGSRFKSTFLRSTKSNSSLREKAAKDGSASLSVSTDQNKAPRSRPRSHSRTASASSFLSRSFGKSSGAALAAQVSSADNTEDATYWSVRLRTTKCAALDVKELGRLRGRLRTEAPGWVDSFIKDGGYLGLLERLKELLEMEWREEQHDDQVLHELLRCFKALTMTACGKRALASHSPTPFLPLAALLFSEKRPGDLPCRQLLVELLLSIYEVCPLSADRLPKTAWATPEISLEPTPSSPSPVSAGGSDGKGSGGVRRYTRKIKTGDEDDVEREEVLTPERIQRARRLVLSLVEGPPNEKEDAKVDFIQQTHRPRVYKTWVTEISDCVRDYFWVFCHANNLFWTLEQIDADAIEAPKVPSGMTGGVEYEAMAYCTAHFRLINAVARTAPTIEEAFRFHNQLFESGFERVLFTLRRASVVYYQSLHLEMSRYISLARSAQFNLGARILACLDRRFLSPQELMVLQQVEQHNYRSRSGAPQIPAIV